MTEPNDPIVTTQTFAASSTPDSAPAVGVDAAAPRTASAPQPLSGHDAPSARPATPAPAQITMPAQIATPPPSATPAQIGASPPIGASEPDSAPGQTAVPGQLAIPGQNGEQERGTTAAQLRRFIKSRPYVPMHELRRRFELNGDCDDVVAIETPDGRCYIGLPEREGRFMGDLVRQGEVGIQLGHDPEVPIVVGVFPMRPVGR